MANAFFGQQQEQLDQVLSTLFGYHLLELSAFAQSDLSRSSRINQRFCVTQAGTNDASVITRFEQLPFASESIDVAILHHALDYSQHPHQLLREASRVLIPRGHLVVVGFNPYSLMGLFGFFSRLFSRDWFWRRNTLPRGRVKDWLHLLELETVEYHQGFFSAPVQSQKVLDKSGFWEGLCRRSRLPVGGYYILVARKERLTMTPIKTRWEGFRPVSGLAVGKPSVGLVEPSGKVAPPSSLATHSGDRPVASNKRKTR
ncbi:MAG: methyltransferase domain-containing protein [Candidatus Pelagadaptatus aseana]